MKLSSYGQLHDYLVSLSATLKSRGGQELSEVVAAAGDLAWGIPTTEFLGESRIALRRILREEGGILNEKERADLSDVLNQLDTALDTQ